MVTVNVIFFMIFLSLPRRYFFFFITNQMHKLFKFILLQNSACFGHILCPSSRVFYCKFGTGKFHADFDERFQAILTLLGSVRQNLHETYQCRMYSRKLLMMGGEDARNM